jgi:hypothetical protein
MIFLPIVARELRVAARRHSTYWLRSAAALAAIVFGTWIFLEIGPSGMAQSELAFALFAILTGSAVFYALFNGVLATFDCLSREKREGTLGLLFLTDLKGYDVVLGKLAASSLNAFYGVLAVLPMLGIPLLMGGITPGEMARMALLALDTLFFSLALGMFVSALCRSARTSIQLAVAVLLFFTAACPAVEAWLEYLGKWPKHRYLLMLPSPGFGYYCAFDHQYKIAPAWMGPAPFWESMAVLNALGWVFLILASLVTPCAWQDKPAGVSGLRWRARWRQWSYGGAAERAAFRKRLLDANAYFWLAARSRSKPAFLWAALGLLACAWVWGIAEFHRDWFTEATYVMTGLLLNALIKTWFASEAGRQLAEDRLEGAFELLLPTPLSVRDILRGQFLALKRQFLGPVLVVLAANLFFMSMLSTRLTGTDMIAEDSDFWISFWLAVSGMLAADLTALYWVGLWQGLVAKSPGRAAVATQARILVVPWLGFALVVLLFALTDPPFLNRATWKFSLGLWFVLGLGTDIFFASQAREKLFAEFRRAATQRYELRPRSGTRLAPRTVPGLAAPPQPAP